MKETGIMEVGKVSYREKVPGALEVRTLVRERERRQESNVQGGSMTLEGIIYFLFLWLEPGLAGSFSYFPVFPFYFLHNTVYFPEIGTLSYHTQYKLCKIMA